MKDERTAETLVGAGVLGAAALFLIYALGVGGFGAGAGGYPLTARFGQAGGLAPGAEVRLAGVKVGAVEEVTLDPQTFMAVAHLSMDRDVKVPADSVAKVTSDGLLGGSHLAIAPGGSPDNLGPGGTFENSQGAVDLFGLIGQVLRPPAPAAAASADPYPGD